MADNGRQSVLRFEDVSLHFGRRRPWRMCPSRFTRARLESSWAAREAARPTYSKVALGLLKPDAGRVFVFGQDITGMKEEELFDMRARVGVLFQEGGLFDSLTIEENVAYPLLNQRLLRIPPAEARPRVEEALRFVELEHTLEKFPSELPAACAAARHRPRRGHRAAAGALRFPHRGAGSHHRLHHHLADHQGARPQEHHDRDRDPSVPGRDLARQFPIQSQKWPSGARAQHGEPAESEPSSWSYGKASWSSREAAPAGSFRGSLSCQVRETLGERYAIGKKGQVGSVTSGNNGPGGHVDPGGPHLPAHRQ